MPRIIRLPLGALLVAALAACQPVTRPPAVQHPASAFASSPTPGVAVAAHTPTAPGQGTDDPFTAADAEMLALDESDGSSSLRSKFRLKKMEPDMVLVELISRLAGVPFPRCPFRAKVLKEPTGKERFLQKMRRGETYTFVPVLLSAGTDNTPDLSDPVTRQNLGACYHAPGTKLVLRIGGGGGKTFTTTGIMTK